MSKESCIDLINNESNLIYIANRDNIIIGFASTHRNKYDVREFRNTLENLHVEKKRVNDLLTSKDMDFVYLDQVSIYPEYQGMGIGKKRLEMILSDNSSPIVSFVVKKSLANKTSAKWHEHLGFKMVATCDRIYKGKKFEW